jgi:hypothetical protein
MKYTFALLTGLLLSPLAPADGVKSNGIGILADDRPH